MCSDNVLGGWQRGGKRQGMVVMDCCLGGWQRGGWRQRMVVMNCWLGGWQRGGWRQGMVVRLTVHYYNLPHPFELGNDDLQRTFEDAAVCPYKNKKNSDAMPPSPEEYVHL